MTGRDVVRRHLELARAELAQQRDDLDVEIKELDNMLTRYGLTGAGSSTVSAAASAPAPTASEPTAPSTLGEAIIEFVERVDADRYVSTNDVVAALEAPGRKPASIRSALPKLADAGRIARPRRGVYGPVANMTPGGTAGTVPPGSVTTERQGGDDRAAGPDSLPDHRETFGGRNTGDQHRETADPVAVDF